MRGLSDQGSSFMHVSTSCLQVLFGSAWHFRFPSHCSRDSLAQKQTKSDLAVAVASPAVNELALAGLP